MAKLLFLSFECWDLSFAFLKNFFKEVIQLVFPTLHADTTINFNQNKENREDIHKKERSYGQRKLERELRE